VGLAGHEEDHRDAAWSVAVAVVAGFVHSPQMVSWVGVMARRAVRDGVGGGNVAFRDYQTFLDDQNCLTFFPFHSVVGCVGAAVASLGSCVAELHQGAFAWQEACSLEEVDGEYDGEGSGLSARSERQGRLAWREGRSLERAEEQQQAWSGMYANCLLVRGLPPPPLLPPPPPPLPPLPLPPHPLRDWSVFEGGAQAV